MLNLRPSSMVAAVVLTGLSLTTLPLSSAFQGHGSQDGGLLDGGATGGLRPVLPTEQRAGDGALVAPAAELDPELWRARLGDADLDRRESSFDDAVALGRRSPEFAAWLEETARAGGELGWTARLALREARRGARGPRGLAPRSPFGGRDPFEVFRGGDPFGFDPFEAWGGGAFGGRSILDALDDALRVAPNGAGQGLRFQMGPDGVEVEVRESVDGEESVRTYRADDLESLLEAHPELRGRIGGRIPGAAPGAVAPSAPAVVRTDILGVRVAPTDPTLGEPDGLIVFDTELGTVAHLLGVGRGDVLLELNGTPLREVSDVAEVLAARPEGGELRLRWIDARGVDTTRVWRPGAADESR